MKTVGTGLAAHLLGETTSLATLFRITLKNDVKYYLTDHDADILIDVDEGGDPQTYYSIGGYDRSTIQNSSGLAVDNLEIQSYFDEAGQNLTEHLVRSGAMDFAQVEIFAVNHKDISLGTIKLRKGYLGEVSLGQNIYKAELRGLAQLLTNSIVEIYTPGCRADLGDRRCKIPIDPPVVPKNTSLEVSFEIGDRYTVYETSLVGVPFVNGGFEEGDLTGWTTTSGSATVKESSSSLEPFEGDFFVEGTQSSSVDFIIEQVVDMTSLLNLSEVDAGNYLFNYTSYRANRSDDLLDEGRILVQFYDASDVLIATPYDSGNEVITPGDLWQARGVEDYIVPATTRKVKVLLYGIYQNGTTTNAGHDSVQAHFYIPESTRTWLHANNVVFKVVQAGITADYDVTFDHTVGAQTTHGTVVFEAEEAYKRHATVTQVINNKQFHISVDEGRAVDGWFDQGYIVWLTGENTDGTKPVRTWTLNSSSGVSGDGIVVLEEAMYWDVEVGDTLTIYPGCNKSVDTCKTKFNNINNFRGEPFVPGADQYLRVPDSPL